MEPLTIWQDREMIKKLWQFIWPSDLELAERINALAIFTIGTYALIAVLLDVLDVVDLTSQRSQTILVFTAGLLLLAYLGESAWRRKSVAVQREALQRIDAFSHPTASHEIPARQIGTALDELLDASQSWRFRGGSARFQRGAALPRLAKITTLDVPVTIQLLDPRDNELCLAYARYREGAGRKFSVRWDSGLRALRDLGNDLRRRLVRKPVPRLANRRPGPNI